MGMSEFYGAHDDGASRELLAAAIERGERFFDTADIYGYGHNERLVGRVLREHPLRASIILATKGGILRDEHDATRRGVDTSPEYILGAIDRSLDRLQTSIDLYYLHRVEDAGARIEESMSALAGAIDAGKIGAVGLSEVSAETIERADAALRRCTEGRQGLAAVQTEYSLMTRNIEQNDVLATCQRLGVLLVAYSPVCRGLLAAPDFDVNTLDADDFRRAMPRFSGDNYVHNQQLARTVAQVARDEGITPAQVALAWVLSRGPNVVAIPGTRKLDRLEENLAAVRITLSDSSLKQLEETFTADAAAGLRYTESAMKAYGLAK